MIGMLHGQVDSIDAVSAIIEVGGVGYETRMPSADLASMHAGQTVKVYTSLNVSQDAITLYGFSSLASKRMFLQLQKVSGIGPKVALSLLSTLPPERLARAVADGDATVKRGSGEEAGGANYEDIVYEGYAPAGVGLIIECLTDNRNRAAAEVRSTLTKGNGSLATSGSVSFNFERKGQIIVPAEGVDFDDLFEKAAEAGAEDVTEDGDVFTVVTDPSEMIDVRKALQDAGFDYDSADLVMMPKNEVELTLEDAQKVSKLIDNLDDLDDVQNIYSNWTASDEVMAQLDEE